MKKNDPVRRKNHHQFLIRQEKERLAKMDKNKQKREYKEALKGLASKLRLDDDIEIDMSNSQKPSSRSHQATMKKKIRKQKKEPEEADQMDLS